MNPNHTNPTTPLTTAAVRATLANTTPTGPVHKAHIASAVRTHTLLNPHAVLGATDTLHADLTGCGPLEDLLKTPGVTDILVNGPDHIWADYGDGLVPAPVHFPDETSIRALATRLAARCGRRLDEQAPFVDAYLPGRIRLHAIIPPIATTGTHISLRIPSQQPLTLPELITRHAIPTEWTDLLHHVVLGRKNFVISGGTGTGKTTLLSALLGIANPQDRFVLAEDTPELAPNQPHVVSLATRTSNVEGKGTVTLGDLIRQALRMRPDRLIVGESRGPEIQELLLAMNTGHAGSGTSLHANNVTQVPSRMIALGALAGLSAEAVAAQIHAAVQVVFHVTRAGARRWVSQVGVLATPQVVTEPPTVLTAATYHPDRGVQRTAGWPQLQALLAETTC